MAAMPGPVVDVVTAPEGPVPSPRPRMITPSSTPTKEKREGGEDKEGDKDDDSFPKSPKKLPFAKEGKGIGPGTKRRTCDENFVPVARALALRACHKYDASIAHELGVEDGASTDQSRQPVRLIASSTIHLPDAGPDSPWARTQLASFSSNICQFCTAGPAAFVTDSISIARFEPQEKLGVSIFPQLRPFLIIVQKGAEDADGMKALVDYMAKTKQMAMVNMRNVETTACLSDSAPTFKRCRVEQLLLVHPDAAASDVGQKYKINVSPHIIGLWIG